MAVLGQEKYVTTAHPDQARWPLPVGVVVGVLFLLLTQLETKWFLFLFLSGLTLAASLAPMDRKEFYLALLIFSIPLGVNLHVYFQRSPVYHTTKGLLIQLTHLPLFALYVIWGFRCVMRKRPPRISFSGLAPLLAVFLSGVISVLYAGISLFGIFDLFALAASILLFIYVASEVRKLRELRLVIFVLMTAIALQGMIAIGQYVTRSTLGLEFFGSAEQLSEVPGLAGLTRVEGTLEHPNRFAQFLDLTLPLSFSLLFCPMARYLKLSLAVVVGFGVTSQAVTLSRGGIVVVGLAFLIILFVRWRQRIGLVRSSFALVSASLVFLVLLGTANPIQRRFLENDYGSAYGRIPSMKVASNVIRGQPFFGIGLNRYTEVAGQYDNTLERITFTLPAPVHNLFLFIASEIGLIGLSCFLLFCLTIMLALRPALHSADPFIQSVGLGLFLGLLAYFAHAQIDFNPWTRWLPFWLILGLAVSVGRLAATTQTEGL